MMEFNMPCSTAQQPECLDPRMLQSCDEGPTSWGVTSDEGTHFRTPSMLLQPSANTQEEMFEQAGTWINTDMTATPAENMVWSFEPARAVEQGQFVSNWDPEIEMVAQEFARIEASSEVQQAVQMSGIPQRPDSNSHPGSSLRSSYAPNHQTAPYPAARPQLQIVTTEAALQPANQAYPSTLPRSAPDIRIQRVDSFPHQPASQASTSNSRRPRAQTNRERPLLMHSLTEPEASHTAPNGYLSPIETFVAGEPAQRDVFVASQSIESPSPVSPRSRRFSRSPSRSPSRSRASSVVSSSSSVSGDHHCESCGKKYANAAKLNHHRRYHTPYEERKNVCDQCGARFLFLRELVRHKQSVTHAGRQFFCEVCRAGFPREDHLKRHIENRSCPGQLPTPVSSEQPSRPASAVSSTSPRPKFRASTGDLRMHRMPYTSYSFLSQPGAPDLLFSPVQPFIDSPMDYPLVHDPSQQWQ